MNRITRVLSVLMIYILLVSIIPLNAFAISTTTYANIVVFVDFKDTTHNHTNSYWGNCYAKDPSDTLQFFNGSNSDDRGLKTYLEKISYGQISVNNIMPQYDGAKIEPLTLDNNTSYYATGKLGVDGTLVMEEVIAYLKTLDLSAYNLDGNSDSVLDNVTVVVPYEYGENNTSITSHNTSWLGVDYIAGKRVGTYNIISEQGLYFGLQDSSLLIHEFLHALTAPDLYCSTGSSPEPIPVGNWDIMASNSQYVQYPLAYIRSNYLGLFDIPEITASGPCSIYAASTATYSTRNNQAIILKTDYSNNEFFVIEYRKQGSNDTNSTDYERKIYGSGLVIYRVDESLETNINGAPYHVYVFREDDDIYKSFFSSESGRTTFSNLTYSDGTNSGITISDIGNTTGDQISFNVTFGEISADYWQTESEKTDISDVGYLVSDNKQYFVSTSDNALTLYEYSDGVWNGIGSKSIPSGYFSPSVIKIGTDYYIAALKGYEDFYIYKYNSSTSTWSDIYSGTAGNTEYAFNTDGTNIYFGLLNAEGMTSSLDVMKYVPSTGQTSKIGATISDCNYAAHPELICVNGKLIAAFVDVFDGNKVYVKQYGSNSTWENLGNLSANAQSFSIKNLGLDLYFLKNDSESVLYKYNLSLGETWEQVGSNPVCTNSVLDTNIAFYNGKPIVAYQNVDVDPSEIYIMYLKNNSWTTLGAKVMSGNNLSFDLSYFDSKIVVPVYSSDYSKVSIKVHSFVDEGYSSHTHVFDQKIIDSSHLKTKATCTKAAVYYYSCSCGEIGTGTFEDGKALGHNYGAWKTNGTTQHKRVCANDASHIEYANHKWNSGVVTKEATCTTTGVKTYTCTTCKATKTETIAKTTSHTWNSGVVTKKATCTATGVKTYTCTTCKATKTETIAKIAHSYSSKTKKCSCGKVNPSYTGLIKDSNGSYSYYVKGVLSTKTGLLKMPKGSNAKAGKTVYLKKGVFQSSYTGLVKKTKDGKTTYQYVSKGILSTKTGLVKMPEGSNAKAEKTVYLKKGVFQSSYTGLVKVDKKYKYVVKGIFTTKSGKVKMPKGSDYYASKTVTLKKGVKK